MTNGYSPPTRPPVSDSLISVVLPVFNEVAVLETLCRRLQTALTLCRTTFEIIFVNDGSRDGSAELLDRLAMTHAEVRVVHLSRNFGHQAAILAGLEHARGDAVVLLDSDLQDPPEAISKLLDGWQGGYDVVYAIRTSRKEALWKRMLFGAFHRVLSSIAHTAIPVDAGNFGLIDARVAKALISCGERDRYLPGLRSWVGFKQIGVPVERGSRYDDHPRVPLGGLFRLAKTAIFSFSSLPLSMFGWIGWIAFIMFLTVSGYSVYCKLCTDWAVPGWTSELVTMSFFASLNALGISMLGEYVVRIYDQVRGRPSYLVDRTINMMHSLEAPSTDTADPTAAEIDAIDLEHLDPIELDAQWDGAYQHLLSQANDLLELGTLMRSESDDLAEFSQIGTSRKGFTSIDDDNVGFAEATTAVGSDMADDDKPMLIKMPLPRDRR
ncbi:MAG: glycosyltransferase family 2 protein [Pirellulales bacterium]|nr:glycosyltransferase family 2 protein [Pirellulales bacterium]